eukprot:CAMPEP_0177647336 /NCGR_PEP_ID=MMETSP0447-20121125/10244_1 /TAXON_ID=0 /ORGANISM="Stygamoeba regulata, Strain BSH-02190019" /LENGTH=217 /DNA_ID=CAMNT_0019149911 /DNA_START=173 /DNA_END=826 /DNA_ORIENTATION=+
MKLIDAAGPNPRIVRFYMAERGIVLDKEECDMLGGANRKEEFLKKNPGGQVPALQLDDGSWIAETVVICEYLEEKFKRTPSLIGDTPEERAVERMWQRRIELQLTEHLYNGFRYKEGIEIFKPRMRVIPEAADGLQAIVQDKLKWLDPLLEGKSFICGDKLTLVDIILFCALDFGKDVNQKIPAELKNVTAWFERMNSRPAAKASSHPKSAEMKMAL